MAQSKGRRANGEGSIFQLSDGRWRYTVRLGKDENGKTRRRDFTGRTRQEVVRRVADERARLGGALQPPVDMTVADLTKQYLAERDPSQAKAKLPQDDDRSEISASYYESLERAYRQLKAHLGMRVDRFTPRDVPTIKSALKREGRGTRTIQVCWQLMRMVFREAIRNELYVRANPWEIHDPPSYEPKPRRALQEREVDAFRIAARGDRFEVAFLLSLFHRLRLGEALGVELPSINFETGAIRIEKQLAKDATVARVKESATDRIIYAGPEILEALQRRIKQMTKEGNPSTFVSSDPDGKHPTRKTVRRHFNAICKAAEIENFVPHGLCHTWSVEAMQDTETSLTVKAQIGGWKSPRMLTERYAMHKREEEHRETSLAIQRRIARKKKPKRAR